MLSKSTTHQTVETPISGCEVIPLPVEEYFLMSSNKSEEAASEKRNADRIDLMVADGAIGSQAIEDLEHS